jgi:hypothetical protein
MSFARLSRRIGLASAIALSPALAGAEEAPSLPAPKCTYDLGWDHTVAQVIVLPQSGFVVKLDNGDGRPFYLKSFDVRKHVFLIPSVKPGKFPRLNDDPLVEMSPFLGEDLKGENKRSDVFAFMTDDLAAFAVNKCLGPDTVKRAILPIPPAPDHDVYAELRYLSPLRQVVYQYG